MTLCRGPDLNRHGRYRPTDFKSVVSTIPPPRQRGKINSLGDSSCMALACCWGNCWDLSPKLLERAHGPLLMIGRQVRVAERHGNALMPEEFLHRRQVDPRHHQT